MTSAFDESEPCESCASLHCCTNSASVRERLSDNDPQPFASCTAFGSHGHPRRRRVPAHFQVLVLLHGQVSVLLRRCNGNGNGNGNGNNGRNDAIAMVSMWCIGDAATATSSRLSACTRA